MPAPPSSPSQTQSLFYTDEQHRLWVRRYRIEVVSGPAAGHSCMLERGSIWIGSAADNDLVIAGDRTVSRRHAELQLQSGGVQVTDLQSTNGTFYHEARIATVLLQGPAEIRLGTARLRIAAEDAEVQVSPSEGPRFSGLVGQSLRMRKLFDLLAHVAPSDATVLIEGETGTGKELIAEALHRESPRRAGPFVIFDASAVAPNLIESELFGHAKGAFTGAVSARAGALERAHGGTLFLDELGELELALQPKLLRAIEAREVRRVGENQARRVDVRVVAATNRNLQAEVAAGRFRSDLYFRVAVVKLAVPPLHERAEDIPLLLREFMGPAGEMPTGAQLERLRARRWSGNVRELHNLAQSAKALGWERALDPEPRSVLPLNDFKQAKEEAVGGFERAYLVELLARTKGNVSAAARLASLDRNHLAKLLQKHGIK